MNNFYIYVYLNPFKKIKYITSARSFEYEPIYVGKGKNNRIFDHITPSYLKINNHRYHLLNKIINEVGLDYYKENFIIKIKDNLIEDNALKLEYDIMYELGTFYDIHPLIKNGPLLNFMLCGVKNPILYGNKNPMYNRSYLDVWKEKYPLIIYNNMLEDHKKILSNAGKKYWNTLNEGDYKKRCETIKKNVNEYWNNLSEDEYENVIRQRTNNFKNFYKKYKTFKNYYIEKFGLVEGLQKEAERNMSISIGILNFWKNASDDFKNKHKLNSYKGLKIFFDNYYSVDNYQLQKLGHAEFKKYKVKLSKKQSNSQKLRWQNITEYEKTIMSNKKKQQYKNFINTLSNEEYLEYKKSISGKNNPMYGKGDLVKGNKNGRATQWIIHMPTGEKYFCDGSFKRFCKDILRKYKPQPHRKYLMEILNTNEPINGWYFKKINKNIDQNIDKKKYIIYE